MAGEINDELLLQCVANYRPLYDKSYEGYKSVLQKENCWRSVADSLNRDVATVKARFKALREKYRREISTEEKLNRSGAPANTRPTWPLMSFFKFLYKSDGQSRQTTTNLPSSSGESSSINSEVETEIITFIDHDYEGCFSPVSNNTWQSEMENTPQRKGKQSTKRKCDRSDVVEIDSVLKDVSSSLLSLNNTDNNGTKYEKFGQYVAAELKDMTTSHADEVMDALTLQLVSFKKRIRDQSFS
ncbi:uncharacterized protein LOC116174930 [Photinus pyralis]|uniref:uncharacterized protein LOC116172791 n=1 Tax=Photinus pyralis TaxID=7054 RepID=UPI0012670525|nr:uncharacterized protein LOC116172791 [Photinus pyralis]XP_031348829.1 uncharacterized protein LOC116174930 [Photinus pyralis]